MACTFPPRYRSHTGPIRMATCTMSAVTMRSACREKTVLPVVRARWIHPTAIATTTAPSIDQRGMRMPGRCLNSRRTSSVFRGGLVVTAAVPEPPQDFDEMQVEWDGGCGVKVTVQEEVGLLQKLLSDNYGSNHVQDAKGARILIQKCTDLLNEHCPEVQLRFELLRFMKLLDNDVLMLQSAHKPETIEERKKVCADRAEIILKILDIIDEEPEEADIRNALNPKPPQ